MRKLIALSALIGSVLLATSVQAAIVGISGTGSLGSFTGSLSYSSSSAGAATLDVTLTNTSAFGFLTGFALNNPGGISGASLVKPPTPAAFDLFSSSNNVNGQPFGQFDFGAGTGPNLEGGNTAGAVGIGSTATFRFSLTGTNLNLIDAPSFLTAFSVDNHNNPTGNFFLARFQGFANGGSDKVSAVPLPGAVLLFGSGLVGVVAWGRVRFVKA